MNLDNQNAEESLQAQESQWCLVGNIVEERCGGEGGKKVRLGTKNFLGGTKVYCLRTSWGDGYQKTKMIGRHRGSKQFITTIANVDYVTNWRAQVVYNPEVLRRIKMAKTQWESKEEVEAYVGILIERQARQIADAQRTKKPVKGTCRYCNAELPSHLSQQCLACGWDWHNPDNPVQRGKANWNRWGINEKLMYHVALCQRADGHRYYGYKTIDEIEVAPEIVRMTDMMSGADVLNWLRSGRKEHLKLTTGEQFLFDAHGIWLTYAEVEHMRCKSPRWWERDQSFWVNGIAPLFPPQ